MLNNILATSVKQKDLLLGKCELQKILRVSAWVTRLVNNFRKIKKKRPLLTSEIQCQKKFYIKREKRKVEHSEEFEESRNGLNL